MFSSFAHRQYTFLPQVTSFFYVIIFCTVLFFSKGTPAFEGIGARSLSLGESLTGTLQANEAIFSNPASITSRPLYSVEAGYVGIDKTVYASVIDSKTASIRGGFGYIYREKMVSDSEQTDHRFKLAYAKHFGNYIAFGLSGSFVMRDYQNVTKKGWNLDLGAMFTPSEFLTFGICFHNLVNDKDYLFYQTLSLGAAFSYKGKISLFYSADRRMEAEEGNVFNHAWGLEGSILPALALRFGILLDNTNGKDYWSTGFGWSSDKFTIHYAFRNTLHKKPDPTHAIAISLLF